jgi:hypothetical protein
MGRKLLIALLLIALALGLLLAWNVYGAALMRAWRGY